MKRLMIFLLLISAFLISFSGAHLHKKFLYQLPLFTNLSVDDSMFNDMEIIDGCIQSNFDFSYPVSRLDFKSDLPEIMPQRPWSNVGKIPSDFNYYSLLLLASNNLDTPKNDVIWLISTDALFPTEEVNNKFSVLQYITSENRWEGKNYQIGRDLYIPLSIVQNRLGKYYSIGKWRNKTVLTYYDQNLDQFFIKYQNDDYEDSAWIISPYDDLWIFTDDNKILKIDIETKEKKELSINYFKTVNEYENDSIVFTNDFGMYFLRTDRSTQQQKYLSYISVEDEELTYKDISHPPFDFQDTTIDFDIEGNLWVGATMYMTPESVWFYTIPDPVLFNHGPVEESYYYGWLKPRIQFVSNDGNIWFASNNGGINLNTNTQKWCWYSTKNLPTIIDDSQGNLWGIYSGYLYKKPGA